MGTTSSYYFYGATGVETPLDIFGSNLVWWINADRSRTDSGSNCEALHDLSASGIDLSQSTPASQPSVQLAELNGKDTVSFDGVQEYMESPSATDLIDVLFRNVDYFCIMITKPRGTTTSQFMFSTRNGADGQGFYMPLYVGTLQRFRWIIRRTDTNQVLLDRTGNDFTRNQWHRVEIEQEIGVANRVRIGGSTKISQSLSASYPSTGSYNKPLTIGRRSSTPVYGAMDLAEIILVDRLPTSGELTDILTYIADEWGL